MFLLSCGESTKNANTSTPKKAWNSQHNPFIFDTKTLKQLKYTSLLSELPLQGKLDRRPWSCDYWPDMRGGISYRWNGNTPDDESRFKYPILNRMSLSRVDLRTLSPSEKFDIFTGHFDFPYTKKERVRTEIMKPGADIPSWTGLCDGWSAASLFFEEPGPVTVKSRAGIDVPFGSADVKALLTYFLTEASSDVYFLGVKCTVDLEDLEKRFKRKLISRHQYLKSLEECSGVNAGAFHIVLANQIGRMKEGFVIDRDPSIEVWNQPVYSYNSHVVSDKKGKSPDSAPGTVREVEIKTVLTYISETDPDWDKIQDPAEEVLDYHYRLEIDSMGRIVGGTWISTMHPDFAWKQDAPTFYDDFESLKLIYEASVGKKVPEHRFSSDARPPRHHHRLVHFPNFF